MDFSNNLTLQWLIGEPASAGATLIFPIVLTKLFNIQVAEERNYTSTASGRYTREMYAQSVTTSSVLYYSAQDGYKHFLVIGI